jgi:hypothetical protein
MTPRSRWAYLLLLTIFADVRVMPIITLNGLPFPPEVRVPKRGETPA